MSAPIGVGDWVECVSSGRGCIDRVVAGRLYLVTGLAPMRGCRVCRQCDRGLVLQTDKDRGDGWCATRFRPIYRPSSELTADLLRRAKEPLRTETEEPVRAREGTRVRAPERTGVVPGCNSKAQANQ